MYEKVPMRIQFEVWNSPSKHSPSHSAEKYGVASNLAAIKILGAILSHVFFIGFPITLSSSAKICRKWLINDEAVYYIHAHDNLPVVVFEGRDIVW